MKGARQEPAPSPPPFEHRSHMHAQAQEDWGAEQSAWLISLSYWTAAIAGTIVVLGLLYLFRVPILRVLSRPLRPLSPLWRVLAALIALTPAANIFRRYLYQGRHLSIA